MPETRRQLPLIGSARLRHGGRDLMTCLYRCGNACDHPVPNQSDNEYFRDVVNTEVSRRGVMRTAAAGALVVGAGAAIGAGPAATAYAAPDDTVPGLPEADTFAFRSPDAARKLTFKPIPPNTLDTLLVPNGYDSSVVIRWGDEVVPGAPRFDVNRQNAHAQAQQFGYNNDFVAVLPLDTGGRRALLVVNHEYTNENLMFPGFTSLDAMSLEQVKIAIAAHGMSVVELERVDRTGEWVVRRTGQRRYNRRITTHTKFFFTGPATGTDLLKTPSDPSGRWAYGTLNNCAGGVTPWGTVLSGEENFNQYFVGGDGAPADLRPKLARYGVDVTNRYPADSRKWERADVRFDLSVQPNEAHRFGWIVELDPFSPDSAPRKHTALGRFKHEGANVIVSKAGHAVAYMGDDERFDYLYKFVSAKKVDGRNTRQARRHNMTLLESGTLYVAKLGYTSAGEIDGSGKLPSDGAFNGTGTWIPLVKEGVSQVDGMTVAEVLVFTRLAGDRVGATKMDRPEDVEPNPKTGKVYAAFTNNTQRGTAGRAPADEANPRNTNRHGHIFEITEAGGDNAATTFTWTIPIVAGDPAAADTYFLGFDKTKVSPISCPDNVAFDGSGNLWIATDGNALGSNDGLFAVQLEGPDAGHLKQFLTVPVGAETCGPYLTTDNRSVFVAVQHPGELTGATVEAPKSTWPDGDFAKPGVAVSWRPDGRPIGS